MLNPTKPAPVSDRHLTSQRVADVLLQAFAKAAPETATAGWFVGSAWINCYPISQKTGEPMVLLLNLCGGAGASAKLDGVDAADAHMGNATLIPAEIVEMEYPLRVLTYRLVEDSGGSGRKVGGRGIRAEFLNVGDTDIQIQCGMEQTNPSRSPWGLKGGGAGKAGFYAIRRPGDDVEELLVPRRYHTLRPGEILVISTGGGGGYGVPPAIQETGVESSEEG
jgi:N-methylhydantoinase B